MVYSCVYRIYIYIFTYIYIYIYIYITLVSFSLSKMFGVLQLSSALPGSYFGLQDLLSTCFLLQFLIQTFFQLSMPGSSGATSFVESGFASELIRVNPVLSKNFFLASFFSCIGLFLVRSAVGPFQAFQVKQTHTKARCVPGLEGAAHQDLQKSGQVSMGTIHTPQKKGLFVASHSVSRTKGISK